MQGLVSFAGQIGNAIAILLPTFCYLTAIALFMFAGWGFWMLARPIIRFAGGRGFLSFRWFCAGFSPPSIALLTNGQCNG